VSPIFVAIDTPELDRALELATSLRAAVGGLKLGLEFFVANGPAGVAQVAKLGLPIFLDLKLHDIPNTVAGAMRSVAPGRRSSGVEVRIVIHAPPASSL